MKKTLLMLAFTVMAATVFVSCKKNDAANGEREHLTGAELEFSDNNGMSLRTDQYTAEYQRACSIVSDSLSCSMIYDTNDMYNLGRFAPGYVFCVPTNFQDYNYLIVIPAKSCAYIIHDLNLLPNYQHVTPRPPTYYLYEILDACFDDVICEGRVYAQSGNTAFTVTSADVSNLSTLEYNLSKMFYCLAVGSYSYQGAIQGQYTMLSRDEFLFSVAKECYNNFYEGVCDNSEF